MPGQPDKSLGIVIVDHGSRLDQSNRMLEELAGQFARRFAHQYAVVEPAHMELAEPSIATAFDKCMERGARRVIICPFFLGPGKHWTHDIPRLAADAAMNRPGVQFHVAATLGIDDLILDLLNKRIGQCLEGELTQFTGVPHSRK
jgi:sirohydrochlorin ferrochelatase